MENVILIRYGEIYLKGNNRYFFESILARNIKMAVSSFECNLKQSQSRYTIENYDLNDEKKIIKALTNVAGIHSVSPAYVVESTEDEIKEIAVKLVKSGEGTFRVTVNRANKKFPINSTQFAGKVGGWILEKYPKLKVNLTEFDQEICIDIRENSKTYLYSEVVLCQDGMPVGTSGRGMVLLSGGIDSPVAAFRMAKRGMDLSYVHFHSFPYTSLQAKEKVVTLAKILKKYTLAGKLLVVPFTKIQQEIHEKCPAEFMITIMRRFMMRIAEKLSEKYGCGAIITGESLGQVASQTMESITVTNSVVKLPVFRPLIGMDKTEIIDVAKKIDTFETSILPYEDCCTVFLPKFPVIKPKLEIIEKAESALDVWGLIDEVINEIEIIEF